MARPIVRALSSLIGAGHRNLDELSRPFAIAHDQLGQSAAKVLDRRGERRPRPDLSGEVEGALLCFPGGEGCQHRVTGRCVAIDGGCSGKVRALACSSDR